MGLSDKLETLNDAVNHKKCAYAILLDKMKPDDVKALENAWAKGYSQRIILQALRAEGYKTSNEAIRAHKTETCKCFRK
jgi:hypothetical protein